jgi:PAS domain S-box-containing protein
MGSILDSAPDAMVVIDSSGLIRFANLQVAALFGYAAGEIVGEPVECLLPERFRARHVSHRRSFSQNVRLRPMGNGLDLFARRKNGTEFPVEISLSPIADGAQTLVAAAIRDVTDRHRIQLELQTAREEAELANKGKSRFLATASHDLRQPLQAVALLNGTMRRMSLDQDLTEALVQQGQAIDAMSKLLNALLDISKLESGAVQPEISEFPVSQLCEQLLNEFMGPAADKGLRLKVQLADQPVQTDPSLVGQVLRNLLSNAIKYTREGHIELRCVPQQDVVRIEVADTGVGIAENELGPIFGEFYQIGIPTNTSRDGYGLGLSIVSRIVKLLDLQLQVRSEIGKGSTFTLVLPAGTSKAQITSVRAPGGKGEAKKGRKPRVLLVEDDQAVLKATRMLLKVEGYEVTTASTVDEALNHANAHHDIELLVTDYHLAQGETGLQVISSMRTILGGDIKVILITGDTSSAVRDLNRDGPIRIASKPINADELVRLLNELVPA